MGAFGFFKKKGAGIGQRERVEELIAQLGDENWEVRLRACQELRGLKAAAAAACPKLQELIDDENGDVCLAAAEAMSTIERGL